MLIQPVVVVHHSLNENFLKRTVYVNGSFVKEDQAHISIFDRGFLFSDSIYEVTSVINSELIDSRKHLKRLRDSLKFLRIQLEITDEEIESIQETLIEKNDLDHGVIYLQISRGSEDRDFLYSDHLEPSVVMFTQRKNFFQDPKAREGISVITQEDNRWTFRDIKTTSLLSSVMAKNEARRNGADDSWYTKDGFVTEGASSNAFIVGLDNVIQTHPLSKDILHGTTRSTVFEIAELLNLTLKEKSFTVEEAIESAEAFITGAGTLVIPVIKINQYMIGDGQPGEITAAIREKYLEVAMGNEFPQV